MTLLKKHLAFTLVEIFIVFAVIAILVILSMPNIMRVRVSMNHTQAKAALKAIGTALESYASDHGAYPSGPSYLLGSDPSYLDINYFEGEHNGYLFAATLDLYSYTLMAEPVSEYAGIKTFILHTGVVFEEG